MRFVRYSAGDDATWGVLHESAVHSLASRPEGAPTIDQFTNPVYLSEVDRWVQQGTLATVPLTDVELLAPVPVPGKIVCIGMNYRDHAEEQDEPIPDAPLLFGKAPTTVTNPGSPIVHPSEGQVDYEVELGVVVGRLAKDISKSTAPDHIAGYTVINDVSERDAQFHDEQWFRGKSFDTFSPMGPTLVPDHGFDPNAVDVEMRVDGETMQSSNTDQFIFDAYELVSYVSHQMTLRPGDVISTGTPGGVGIFRDPVELLAPGQTCEAEIEGIGTLSNPVVAE